jgi:flagellar assembly protein FliH
MWEPGSPDAGLVAADATDATDADAVSPGLTVRDPAFEAATDPAGVGAPALLVVTHAQALEAARQAGFEAGHAAGHLAGHLDGRAAGREEALAGMEEERARLRQVVAATDAAVQRPEVLFEPLKRLALHIARELVRCELSLSPHAVDHLIRGCLVALDAPVERIIVSLNPDDFRLITADASLGGGLTFESDDSLSAGSVRVRADETRVIDFIEHRLRALADTLLSDGQPGLPR